MAESRSASVAGDKSDPRAQMNLVYGEIIEVFTGGRDADGQGFGFTERSKKIPLGLLTDAVQGDKS